MESLQAVALGLILILPLGWGLRFAGKKIKVPAALSLMSLGLVLGPELANLIPSGYIQGLSLIHI